MKLTSINTTFNNKFGEMTTILIAYFKYWKVIKEQKAFEIPTEIWDKFADNNKIHSNNEVKTIFDEAMTNYLNKLKDNEDTNDNLELLNTIKLDITGDETSSDNSTYQSILKNASSNLQISYFKFIISDEEPLIYQIENYDAKMKPRDKQLEQKIKEFLKKDYDWNFDIDTTLEQVELTLKRKLQETLSNEYNRINTLELIVKEKTTLKEYIKTKDNHTNFLLKIKVGNLQENTTLTLKLINIKQSDQVVFTEIKNFLKQEFDLDVKFTNSIVETLEKLNQKIQDKFKNEKIKITLTKKTNLKWNDLITDRNYFGVSSTDKKGYFMVNIQFGNIQETNFKIIIINIK